jgi:cytidylate kinase
MVPVNAPSSAPDSAPFIVTIDGPAASGKSSVSREVAKRVGWSWVSTGAFYRGLAYIAYAKKSDLKNEPALVELAQGSDWAVRMTSEQTCVFMGTKDVTDEIGKEEVGSLASKISSFPRVRAALLDAQRQCAVGVPGLVAEGRDCGTVVFPDAQVKIFLTARAEDRAQRRAVEEGRDVGHIVKEQQKRDAQDANRKAAPLQAPEDAHVIDTTDLSFMEVVERVEEYIAKARQR